MISEGNASEASTRQAQKTAEPMLLLLVYAIVSPYMIPKTTISSKLASCQNIFAKWITFTILDDECHPSILCILKYKLKEIRKPSWLAIHLKTNIQNMKTSLYSLPSSPTTCGG